MVMKVNGKVIRWKDPLKGDFLTDVKVHTLWEDRKTGANLTLIKASPGKGPVMKAHVHPNANEWSLYLAGEGEYADGSRVTVSADDTTFQYNPKGETHGYTPRDEDSKITREFVWVRYHDGPSMRVNK
jgi:hypothetical protein